MPDRVSAIFQNRTAVAAVVGGADRRLRRAVGVINFRFVQQMIHIDAPQYIAAADEQAQGGRDFPQMVHLCQQIREPAEHGHMAALHEIHQRMNIRFVLIRRNCQRRAV